MTKREKRLRKIRQNPKNVRYDDLVTIMQEYGFTLRQTSGSHVIARCEIDQQVWTQTFVKPHGRKNVRPIYVKRIIKTLDEIIEAIEKSEEDEDDYGN